MKKLLICVSVFLLLCISFTACLSEGQVIVHEEDLEESMYDSYRKGANAAKEQIEEQLWEDFWDLGSSRNSDYGMDIETAIILLANYADGEPTSKRDVIDAIWTVHSFYNGLDDLINGIEDYWVD